jgi:hypothetical protein
VRGVIDDAPLVFGGRAEPFEHRFL